MVLISYLTELFVKNLNIFYNKSRTAIQKKNLHPKKIPDKLLKNVTF